MTDQWEQLPSIDVPVPVPALAPGMGRIWAGGAGGVAWRAVDGTWHLAIGGLPLHSVAALAYAGGWLLAGGAGGIARSRDGGDTWQAAHIDGEATVVAALAPSPRFVEDTTALAATLGQGVLRTVDAGRSWKAANFGLTSFEVTALLWLDDDVALAATNDGIFRSPNAGRAWRIAEGSQGAPVAALVVQPDGSVIAAVELGGLLRSADYGVSWTPHGELPPDIEITSLLADGASLLVGSLSGLLELAGGAVKQLSAAPVLALARLEHTPYAGGDMGILAGGATGWSGPERPPLHDLRRLLLVDGNPLLYGVHSAPLRYSREPGWLELHAPLPLTALAVAPDGALLASSTSGLYRSTDGGISWNSVLDGDSGCVARVSFRPDGSGWAASAGGLLLRTHDHGLSWELLAWPFGVMPLAALQALPDGVFAVTYDQRRHVAQLWRSSDGTDWLPGAAVGTAWPLVATLDTPPLLTLGGHVFVERAGRWEQHLIGDGGVLRVLGRDGTLLALTAGGLHRSTDGGLSWRRDTGLLPPGPVLDLALSEHTLYALTVGGVVLTRRFVIREIGGVRGDVPGAKAPG